MRAFLFGLLMLPSLATAQTVSPLNPGPTADELSQAQAAATAAAQLASDAANAAASACKPAAAVPPMETVGGAAGSGTNCRLANSVQPRISRTVAFTTAAGGTASVTWADMGTTPLLFVVPNVTSGATQGPLCYPVSGTITATGATVKCYTTQTVTVSILGAVVAPLTTAGSGVSGQVLALPATN